MNKADPVSDLCNMIRSGRTAFFSGAGISKNSGLPLANNVIGTIFEECTHYPEDLPHFSKINLPMEYILETFSRYHSVDPIIDMFLEGQPSSSHHFIAQLHSSNLIKTSATTNIDILLERVYGRRNIGIRPVLPDQNFTPDEKAPLFLKLHGTADDRTSAMITLSHIGKKRKNEWMDKAIQHLFSHGFHDTIIVLGYSCSDHFDISPIIKGVPQHKRKNVIYINHQPGKQIHELEEKIHSGLFSGYNGKVIEVDTDHLIKKLSEDLGLDFIHESNLKLETNWKQIIKDWAKEIKSKSGLSSLILGRIAYYGGLYTLAKKYYKDALTRATDDLFRIQCNYFLSQIAGENGRYQDADLFASNAVDLFHGIMVHNNSHNTQDLVVRALEAHYAKSLAQFDLGYNKKNKKNSIVYFEKSKHHLEQMKQFLENDKVESFKVAYHLLGGLLYSHWPAGPKLRKDYDIITIKHYEDCLKLTRQYGDIAQEADCYNDYAIFLTKSRRFIEAEEQLLDALELYEKLNDEAAISISLVNLAAARFGLGKIDPVNLFVARALLRKVIKLKKKIGQSKILKNQHKYWYIKRKIKQENPIDKKKILAHFDNLSLKFQQKSDYAVKALSEYNNEILK